MYLNSILLYWRKWANPQIKGNLLNYQQLDWWLVTFQPGYQLGLGLTFDFGYVICPWPLTQFLDSCMLKILFSFLLFTASVIICLGISHRLTSLSCTKKWAYRWAISCSKFFFKKIINYCHWEKEIWTMHFFFFFFFVDTMHFLLVILKCIYFILFYFFLENFKL